MTGEHANVPRDVVASLLLIHVADIIEQMNGFEFEFAFAVFYVLQPCFELPGCFAELQAGGLAPERLSIRINPQRGTFGLYPILGLTPHLLDMRTRLNVALRGRDELSKRATTALLNLQARHPYLFDLAWLLARRGNLACGEQALLMQKRAEQLLRAWGAPWLKSPFDADASYLGFRQAQLSTS